MTDLVRRLLTGAQWSEFYDVRGPAVNIPLSLEKLIEASNSSDADEAYWEIENRAYVQGGLYSSCILIVDVILAAIATCKMSEHSKSWLIEMLFQIVNGRSAEYENGRETDSIREECRLRAQKGLWLLYNELFVKNNKLAYDIIEILEDDTHRINFLKDCQPAFDVGH